MSKSIIKLLRQEAKFIAGAAKANQIPKSNAPEIAFIGKSNVGKSSLINAVCNRKTLARVSHTPGRTRQLNFFSLADKITIVDMPGYGFANVPIKVKAEWQKLIMYYFENRANLVIVNLLIDARIGIKENDIKAMKILSQYHRDFQIVFTKTDKVKDTENLVNTCKNFLASLGYLCNVICTSSRSKEGVHELQRSFAKCI